MSPFTKRKAAAATSLAKAKLKVGRYAFDRYGSKVVFVGRLMSVLRTYAAFLAGTKDAVAPFPGGHAAGGIIWSGIYTFASYLAGKTLRRVSGTVNLVILGAAVVALVVVFFLVRRKTNQLVAVAEAAYPGSLEG